ncbi:MAG TPA: phosphate acyltransferase [Candidatus Saccharimonadales bacterium]|nr:phosphate acyltransferase [Candidatus Saccharimonadales bacterium]
METRKESLTMTQGEDYTPTVLLPEADDPTVAEVQQDPQLHEFEQELGAKIQFGKEGEPMTLEDAAEQLNKGGKEGGVDIVIAGAAHGSPDVIRTAIRHVNRKSENPEDHQRFVHSFFIMERDGEDPLFFADCAVNEAPDRNQLVHIAEDTAESVRQLGHEPVVAFLSLSTFGSADASKLMGVQQTREAYKKFKERNPDTPAYGEIQVDAALDHDVFVKKAKQAGIELANGQMPNVFIFPDGASGNIGYKLVEQLAGHVAVGPMLNGIAKDWHDLSRGVKKDGLMRSIYYAVQLYEARQQAKEAEQQKQAA